ncbi:Uncharacterised protein [Serratia ficaria]|nr:Uncharacterised protein [Serratia ficaria]
MLEQTISTLSKRCPGFRLNATALIPWNGVQLLVEGVNFNLVYRRDHFIECDKVSQSVRMEIADANGANFACLLQFFHCTPCPMDIAVRLVNQVQVNVIKLQPIQGAFELCFSAFVIGILQPQLGRYKEFVPCDTGLFKCVPDLGFILVRRCGIDQAVSRIDGINNGSFAFGGIRHLKHTKSLQGHFNTVVQFYSLHDVILSCCVGRA